MDDAARFGILKELRSAIRGLSEAQRSVLDVTGVAWSDDRLVKVTVGPRGQLVDLELDPRLFRKPDSRELAAMILATARAAVEDTMRQTTEILGALLSADLLTAGGGELDLAELTLRHDAELRLTEENDHDRH